MKSEKIIIKNNSYSVNISGSRVDSYRCKKDMNTVVRVYDGGNIGIAAAVGEDDGTLLEKAQAKLSQGIAYPDNIPENITRSEDALTVVIPEDELVTTVKRLVSKLVEAYPDFIYSYKVIEETVEIDYSNSCNTNLCYKGGNLGIYLQMKEKKSANIMDLFFDATVKSYDEDGIVSDMGRLLSVYNNKVDFPDEEVPVVIGMGEIIYNILPEITAEKYMAGASLFNGKLGEKVFSEKLTLFSDKSPENKHNTPFFDAEGTTVSGDRHIFINKGKLEAIAAYRRTSAMFNLPLTGSAYSDFDAVPRTAFNGITVETNGVKLSEVATGKSIYIAVASGGDMSPDGVYATPVMVAYLCEDGKPVGVLPPFGISASVYDALGGDLIAVADNDMFTCKDEKVIITKLKINK